MARPEFHELEVCAVRRLTEDSVAISFDVPPHLKSAFAFIPGQYLTLRTEINGEDIRRSYSISSGVDDALEVGIKRVEQGLFSTMAQSLAVGDRLQVMTSQGNFRAEIGGKHRYLLIAAGSGITPCLSIAKSVLSAEPDSEVVMLYGNRNSSTIMFRDDINALKDSYTKRFMVAHLMSAERQDAQLLNGRIDGEKITLLNQSGLIDVMASDGIYLCGPQEMIEQAKAVLTKLGVLEAKIHFELFTTANADGTHRKAPVARPNEAPLNDGTNVKIIIDGVERDISVNAQHETVLAAAQKAGMDLPFSCAGGMCCTCRCKVVAGGTAMDMNYSLADWEVEAGFTLACQTRPLDGEVVLDFDAT